MNSEQIREGIKLRLIQVQPDADELFQFLHKNGVVILTEPSFDKQGKITGFRAFEPLIDEVKDERTII